MALFEKLKEAGFSPEKAEKLAKNEWVRSHFKNKPAEHIAGLIDSVAKTLSIPRAVAIRMAASHPVVLGYDIEAKMKQMKPIYGDIERIRLACVKFPRFLGLNHSVKISSFARTVRPYGVKRAHVLDAVLERPYLISFSSTKIKAVIEVGKVLVAEGHTDKASFFQAWQKTPITSPYVPHTNDLSIFQARRKGILTEPPLLVKMRKRFIKDNNAR